MNHSQLLSSAQELSPDIIALRRAIHAEPELGLHTPKTMAKVRCALADLPLEWREGGETTGQVAILRAAPGKDGGQRVLLRGDMDALPITEDTGLEFASKTAGHMHACGHDTHTAMLVGAVKILAERKDQLAGDVMFMFQPGEEGFHGARYMLDDGLIDPLPDAAFALHIMPNMPHGLIAGRAGPLMAAADQFDITITGKGGHGSMPHDANDPVPVAAQIITALQSMITRRFNIADPVVLTVTQLDAGTMHNVIPDSVRLRGTMRSLSAEARTNLHQRTDALVRGIAEAHDMRAETTVTPGFPVTVCDERAVALGAAEAHSQFGQMGFHPLPEPVMGAEDFAYVLERVPGAMFFLGVAKPEDDWQNLPSIHNARMMVDEAALPRGSAFLAGCALRFLDHGWADSAGE